MRSLLPEHREDNNAPPADMLIPMVKNEQNDDDPDDDGAPVECTDTVFPPHLAAIVMPTSNGPITQVICYLHMYIIMEGIAGH